MKPITEINVRKLLPQKGRFVMVDRLEQCDEETTVSTLLVREDNIFVSDGFFLEAGLLEHMAQTAAARNGYMDKYIHHRDITLGFIGEIKNVLISRCPRVGELLTTKVIAGNEILSTLIITVEVKIGDELIVNGNMKIGMTTISTQT